RVALEGGCEHGQRFVRALGFVAEETGQIEADLRGIALRARTLEATAHEIDPAQGVAFEAQTMVLLARQGVEQTIVSVGLRQRGGEAGLGLFAAIEFAASDFISAIFAEALA